MNFCSIFVILLAYFQKIENLREELREKFDKQDKPSDEVKIAFKLSDGTITKQSFSKTSTIKVYTAKLFS